MDNERVNLYKREVYPYLLKLCLREGVEPRKGSRMAGQPINEALRSSTRKGLSSQRVKSFAYLKPYDIAQHARLERLKRVRRRRTPILEREKIAFIYLRSRGLSINSLATVFDRSTSVVSRILKQGVAVGLHLIDLRKSAHFGRLRVTAFLHHKLVTLLAQWQAWILNEEEKPP